jgi:hypothetical protein
MFNLAIGYKKNRQPLIGYRCLTKNYEMSHMDMASWWWISPWWLGRQSSYIATINKYVESKKKLNSPTANKPIESRCPCPNRTLPIYAMIKEEHYSFTKPMRIKLHLIIRN